MIISKKKYHEELEKARCEGAERVYQEMRVQKMSDKIYELEAKQGCGNAPCESVPVPRPCQCRCAR